MTEPRPQDALVQQYLEASAQDPRRPPDRVREAVRAHAQAVVAARTPAAAVNTIATAHATDRPAANQSRWKLSLLASVALAGITGLLVLQFERAPPEERAAALGAAAPRRDSDNGQVAAVNPPRAPAVAPASPTASLKAPAPAPTPAQASLAIESAKPPPARSIDSGQDKPASAAATQEPAMPERPALPVPASQADTRAEVMPGSSPGGDTSNTENSTKSSAVSRAMTPAPRAIAPALQVAPDAEASPPAARAKASPARDLQQAMLQAARAGNTAQLESLLQQGAALNAVDDTGRTALIWAAINNHTSSVQKLLALGADKNVKDREGLSALQHARKLEFERMAALLEAAP